MTLVSVICSHLYKFKLVRSGQPSSIMSTIASSTVLHSRRFRSVSLRQCAVSASKIGDSILHSRRFKRISCGQRFSNEATWFADRFGHLERFKLTNRGQSPTHSKQLFNALHPEKSNRSSSPCLLVSNVWILLSCSKTQSCSPRRVSRVQFSVIIEMLLLVTWKHANKLRVTSCEPVLASCMTPPSVTCTQSQIYKVAVRVQLGFE